MFEEATHALRGPEGLTGGEQRILEADFEAVLLSGAQPRRHYHTNDHYRDVATAPCSVDEMGSHCSNLQEALHTLHLMEHYGFITQVMMRAGWHHDVVYAHIDETIHPAIAVALAPFFQEGEGSYRLPSDPRAPDELCRIYDLALTVFGFYRGQLLDPFGGQNEFLSALYGALQGVKAGLPLKCLLAEMTMIEATIPFRLPSRVPALRSRVITTNHQLGSEGLEESEIEALMLGAVFMANHDVIGFRKPFEQFNRGSHQLLMEGAPTLQTPEGMFSACMRLAHFLARVGTQEADGIASVFHSYAGFPAKEVRDQWDRVAQINCEVQRDRMKSYAASALLLAAAAMRQGHPAPGPAQFSELFADASLEPPDHIFPRPMHEIRLLLEKADLGYLIDTRKESAAFLKDQSDAQHILDGVRPALLEEVMVRLALSYTQDNRHTGSR